MSARTGIAWVLAATAGLAACGGGPGPLPKAKADRGRDLIVREGCGACHRIGGVRGADGRIGPSLESFKGKRYIAGQLTNTPRNVVRFIRDPRAVEPKTIMPDLGLTKAEAREIVDYLYAQ